MRNTLRLGLVALVLVAVLALPAGAAAPDEAQPGITVTGTSLVPVTPDIAEWSFGVQARSASASGALRTASQRLRAVVAAVRRAGVARADIQTQSVSLYPNTEESGEVSGFFASGSVRVVVRTLSRSGAVVQAAVDAGGTDVYGPSMTPSNRRELYDRALARAYDEARAKAELLASKVGATLGRPVAVIEGGGEGGEEYAYAERASGGGDMLALEPEPGRTEIGATVTVTFAVS